MKPILIAPSLLAANSLQFLDEIKSVEAAGADWHHVDVMDGHFVPNLSYGLPLVKAFKSVASIPLDVHIMVANPDQVAMDYIEAGADILVFPFESARHHHRLVQQIKGVGCKAGIAINPATPVAGLVDIIGDLDLVNVMSVNPGFGGQSFIPRAVEKIKELKDLIEHSGSQACIEVDGGVNSETAKLVREAGANVLVAGTAVFKAPDRAAMIQELRG